MARIIYSALVESIRGSIKGTTFQRNRYGYTVKGKPNMISPYRLLQRYRQSQFASNARKWRQITDTNRTQWNSYAENFPIPSRLNPDSNLSGFDYFLKYHNWLTLFDLTGLLADPGSTQDAFTIDDITLTLNAGSLVLLVQMLDTPSNCKCLMFLTPPIPLGREFVNITPRFMIKVDEVIGSFTGNVTDAYEDAFGSLPADGDFVGIKLVFIRTDNAQMIQIATTQIEVL